MRDNQTNNIELTEMTDEELVEQCKDNSNDNAFNILMNRYAKAIYSFALQYTKKPDDAEDIAQDSFFKAWKHIKRFTNGNKWRSWIYAITRNTALDHIKKKKAYVFSDLDNEESDIAFAETLEDNTPLADIVFDQNQTSEEIQELLKILHPDHSAVLMMHYRDSMTFDEISVVLGKPMNTVKSWHRRALSKLKTEMVHHKK